MVFLAMCFVKYTPFIVPFISMTADALVVYHLQEPDLWNIFKFLLCAQFFLCMLGELLRRVLSVQAQDIDQHHREAALMHAVRLNQREIEAYLLMSSNALPTDDETDRLFSMLKPSSQRNIINAVHQHLHNHLSDSCNLANLLPLLTKSKVEVCNLILQGKKRSEIDRLLNKTEKNIDVVRAHIRKKLNIPGEQDLKKYLIKLLLEKEQ